MSTRRRARVLFAVCLALAIAGEVALPREAELTTATRRRVSPGITGPYVVTAGSSSQRRVRTGHVKIPVGSGVCGGAGVACCWHCPADMTAWNTALIILAASNVAVMSPRAAAAETSGPSQLTSNGDRQAFARYRAELEQLVTDAEGHATGADAGVAPARIADCKLFRADAHTLDARECTACHALHTTHPVDFDYDVARSKPGADLRDAAEVVRRGVFLPDGKVRCVTCHDARSRWQYRLVLPPGAPVRAPVNPRDPTTYVDGARPALPAALLPSGSSVSPTPLCKVCHTIGE